MPPRNLESIVRLMEWNSVTAAQDLHESAAVLSFAVGESTRVEARLATSAAALAQSGSATKNFSIARYRLRSQMVDDELSAVIHQKTIVAELTAATERARAATMEARRRVEVVRQVSDRRRQLETAVQLKRSELESGDVWLSRWSPAK